VYKHFKDPTCTNSGFIKSVAMALVNNTRSGQELPLRPPRNLQKPAISAKKRFGVSGVVETEPATQAQS
jgi:hypothetical protein